MKNKTEITYLAAFLIALIFVEIFLWQTEVITPGIKVLSLILAVVGFNGGYVQFKIVVRNKI